MLDGGPYRRGDQLAGPRRALVHEFPDRLTINFAGDYTGGVAVATSPTRSIRITDGWLGGVRVAFEDGGAYLDLAAADLELSNGPGHRISMGDGGVSISSVAGASLNGGAQGVTIGGNSVSILSSDQGIAIDAGEGVVDVRGTLRVDEIAGGAHADYLEVHTLRGSPADDPDSAAIIFEAERLALSRTPLDGAEHPAKIALQHGVDDTLLINPRAGYAGGVAVAGQLAVVGAGGLMAAHHHKLVITNETILAQTAVAGLPAETLDPVREIKALSQTVLKLEQRIQQLEAALNP